MTAYKPKIVLSHEVHKTIKWLTLNYDNEIGALGAGKIRTKDNEKYIYIDKLFFPKQKVTSATVHITAEMYASLYKDEEYMARMGDICFYWHRHPGSSPHHSQTDAEDTFDTLLSNEKGTRNWFAFLQTARGTNGVIVSESRVDFKTPLRVTIEDKDIELTYEMSPKERDFEVKMEKIIDTCIVKDTPVKTYTPAVTDNDRAISTLFANNKPNALDAKIGDIKKYFNVDTNKGKNGHTTYIDNDTINDMPTAKEDKVSLFFGDGHIVIRTAKAFEKILKSALGDKKNSLPSLVRKWHLRSSKLESEKKVYDLQPDGKCYYKMQVAILNMFITYNKEILNKITSNKKNDTPKPDDDELTIFRRDSPNTYVVVGFWAVSTVLDQLELSVDLRYSQDGNVVVYERETTKEIGKIDILENTWDKARFIGADLIPHVLEITDVLQDDIKIGTNYMEQKESEEE